MTPNGDLLVVGAFQGTIDLGTGPLTSVSGRDAFLAKLDKNGKLVFAMSFSGTSDQVAMGVAAGADGSIFVTGQFDYSIKFGESTLAGSPNDGFITKLDPNGAHVWSHSLEGIEVTTSGLAVDQENDAVYVAGGARGLKLDGGAVLVPDSGEGDGFVVRFNGQGTLGWTAVIDGAAQSRAVAVAAHPTGGCVVTGYVAGGVKFGGAPTVPSGAVDAFVARIDATGSFAFGRVFGSDPAWQMGRAVAVKATGAAVVTGFFDGTIALAGTPTACKGETDLFVAEFDELGKTSWARTFGSASTEWGDGVALDSAGNAYVVGHSEGTLDFGGGELPSSTGAALVVKLSATGTHLFSKAFQGGPGAWGRAVAADPVGSIAVAGSAETAIDFGGGALPGTTVDAVLARLAQ